jgi:hypothetical protein
VVEANLRRKNAALDEDTTSRVKHNPKAFRAFMDAFYPRPKRASEATAASATRDPANADIQLTENEEGAFAAAVAAIPELKTGCSKQLYRQWLATYRAEYSEHRRQPPMAPDGYIPNSVVWKQMAEWGARRADPEIREYVLL